jgi:hypothetical protein
MIDAATVEGFRGLRRLDIDGFARVNLIVGKNDCGKTALMEALMIAEGADGAANRVLFAQSLRRSAEGAKDFDRFWRPLFWNQDAEQGFSVELRASGREPLRIELRKSAPPPTMLLDPALGGPAAWAIEIRIVQQRERTEQILGGAAGLRLPPAPVSGSAWWVPPYRAIGPELFRLFSRLKQAGREAELLDLLTEIDGRISGIEILVPGGIEPELHVRQGPGVPLLPIGMMGDGFQRCFEIGVAAVMHEWPFLYVDEIDNGLHHTVLEPVWRWLALLSQKRGLQIFATTHSEECIHAACRAFTALNDDGLRVLRLDRREDRTTAALYDRALVETAAETGVEIRG